MRKTAPSMTFSTAPTRRCIAPRKTVATGLRLIRECFLWYEKLSAYYLENNYVCIILFRENLYDGYRFIFRSRRHAGQYRAGTLGGVAARHSALWLRHYLDN